MFTLATTTDLEGHLNCNITVTCDGVMHPDCHLLEVYTDGRFTVITPYGVEALFTLHYATVTVVPVTGSQLSGCGVHSFYVD
jgi:hypothetical protein